MHHVVVVVARKPGAQSVGGLARLAGADGVGKDDVVAPRIERLPRAEKLARERRIQHAGARAVRAVKNEHRFARRGAHRRVVQPQLRQHFAGVKLEIAHHPGTFLRRGVIGSERDTDRAKQRGQKRLHGILLSDGDRGLDRGVRVVFLEREIFVAELVDVLHRRIEAQAREGRGSRFSRSRACSRWLR